MQTYYVEYYTFVKGRKADDSIDYSKKGINGVCYVECSDTSEIDGLLKKYSEKSIDEIYCSPVIISIKAVKGHCIKS